MMMNRPIPTWLMLSLALCAAPLAGAAEPADIGRQIYLEGKLPDGQPLTGLRAGTPLSGRDAACVSCHRGSGLGSVEGNEIIPPITGRALFGEGAPVVVQQNRRFEPGLSVAHAPYDAAAFAAAVRQGHHIAGHDMNGLMPRYDLSDTQLQAVAAYLRTLSTTWSPGVAQDDIHLATVIAPGVDPVRRKAFLDTLNAAINQHNVNVVSGLRQRISVVERKLKTRRKWSLEVRDLSGPSSTWNAQLDDWQQRNPAFAILSGLGLDEWQPVQDFCERSHVACWFPSLDVVPQGAANSAYSLYFSEGVALEAKVIAHRHTAQTKPGHLLQIVSPEPRARAAASALQQSLSGSGTEVQTLDWDEKQPEKLAAAIRQLQAQDALALWTDCAALEKITTAAAPVSAVFTSATLCMEEPLQLPESWKAQTWTLQRLELPTMRAANLSRFKGWAKFRNLPLVDEKTQSEAFAAFNMLAVMLGDMLNNLHTDYLIERAESTLSMRESMQVQEEVQSMMMGGGGRRAPSKHATDPASSADASAEAMPATYNVVDIHEMMKRKGTTAYPRMTLGPGQRFASHGAYLVRACAAGAVPCETPEWVVPGKHE